MYMLCWTAHPSPHQHISKSLHGLADTDWCSSIWVQFLHKILCYLHFRQMTFQTGMSHRLRSCRHTNTPHIVAAQHVYMHFIEFYSICPTYRMTTFHVLLVHQLVNTGSTQSCRHPHLYHQLRNWEYAVLAFILHNVRTMCLTPSNTQVHSVYTYTPT